MSIVDRLEDARILLDAGRDEGALLCVLTAVSGTSRVRFPPGTPSRRRPGNDMGDGEAFAQFFAEAMPNIGMNINVRTADGMRSFGYVLYKLFRCSLAHEAGLSPRANFIPDDAPGCPHLRFDSPDPLAFTISHSTVVLIADVVARAPENLHAATEVRARIMSRLPQWVPSPA